MKTIQLAYDHWLTLSGRRIDSVCKSTRLQRKIAGLSGWFWNALLNWDNHTVDEVLAAHEQFDYDPNAVVVSHDEEERIHSAVAQFEWTEFLTLAVQIADQKPAALQEWRGWQVHELASVVGLRLIDHAVRLLERGQLEAAACLLMDATQANSYVYELGSTKRRNISNEDVATELYFANKFKQWERHSVRIENAKAGANARHGVTRKLKQFALNLASQKSYRSKRQAAKGVLASVLTEARRLGRPLSNDRAEKTIYEWILGGK